MSSFKHYILVIAISMLPFISMFLTPLAPHTHDVVAHLPRIGAYYKALTGGQILPRWAADLNYGYGMPLFNFIYHVPYLVASIPVMFGATLVFSYKFALLVSFLLSGVFMYLFSFTFFKNTATALIVTVLYQFAPFHLIDLVVRGDMAEGFAAAFLPLLLYAVTQERLVLTGITAALLILSHNSISLLYFGVATLFILFFSKKKLPALFGLGLGLALSAFYWIPAIIERKYTYGDLFMKDIYATHFVNPILFFIPNITDAKSLAVGGVAVSFGILQTLTLLAALFRKVEKHILRFCLVLTAFSIFMMTPLSLPLWQGIPILRMFQFPWRFLNVTVFSLAFLAGGLLVRKKIPKHILALLVTLTILPTVVYFRPPLGFDYKDNQEFWNYPLNTTFFGETDVIWSAGPASSFPRERFAVVGGEGTISNTEKQDTTHTFTVTAHTDVHVVDHTQFFPGWRVFANGNKIPIEFQDQNWRGLITFRLPPGEYSVRVEWGRSPVRQIAETVTVLSLLGVCISFIFPKLKRYVTT